MLDHSPPVEAPTSDIDESGTDLLPPPVPVPASLQPWDDPHPLIGWLVTLLMVTVAGLTRFWALGFPSTKSFDEVYYATEAQEISRFGYEDNRGYMFIVHPPLGKWLISFSSDIFGNNSLGWRVAPALAGIIGVLLITRIARRMFHSNLFGGIAGLLMALDGMSLVLSRVALLDIFVQTFILAGFGALIADRDQVRGRLAGLLSGGVDLTSSVPTLGPRPWRLTAGVMFGLACGTKWTALSSFVLFVILSLWWDRGALKAAGVRQSWRGAVHRSWIAAIGTMAPPTWTRSPTRAQRRRRLRRHQLPDQRNHSDLRRDLPGTYDRRQRSRLHAKQLRRLRHLQHRSRLPPHRDLEHHRNT